MPIRTIAGGVEEKTSDLCSVSEKSQMKILPVFTQEKPEKVFHKSDAEIFSSA